MTLSEDKAAKNGRPVCTVVDLANRVEKGKVTKAMQSFSYPGHAAATWERIRKHSEEASSTRVFNKHGARNHHVSDWDVQRLEYRGHCCSTVEWDAIVRGFEQAYLMYMWHRRREDKEKADVSVENFAAWKKEVLDSLPTFRQVLLLRMHTYKNKAFGLEEFTL
jgi:hypothetical protein